MRILTFFLLQTMDVRFAIENQRIDYFHHHGFVVIIITMAIVYYSNNIVWSLACHLGVRSQNSRIKIHDVQGLRPMCAFRNFNTHEFYVWFVMCSVTVEF